MLARLQKHASTLRVCHTVHSYDHKTNFKISLFFFLKYLGKEIVYKNPI